MSLFQRMCRRLYNAAQDPFNRVCSVAATTRTSSGVVIRGASRTPPAPRASIGPKILHLCHSCVVKQAPFYQQSFRTAILAICAAELGLIIAQRPAEPTYVLPRRQLHQICALGTAEPVGAQPSRKWVVDFSLFLLHPKRILPV